MLFLHCLFPLRYLKKTLLHCPPSSDQLQLQLIFGCMNFLPTVASSHLCIFPMSPDLAPTGTHSSLTLFLTYQASGLSVPTDTGCHWFSAVDKLIANSVLILTGFWFSEETP